MTHELLNQLVVFEWVTGIQQIHTASNATDDDVYIVKAKGSLRRLAQDETVQVVKREVPSPKTHYTVREAAKILGMHEKTLYTEIQLSRVKFVKARLPKKLRAQWLITADEMERLKNDRIQQAV